MYKEDLELNNLQGLRCHKTQPNQTKPILPDTSIISLTTIMSVFA